MPTPIRHRPHRPRRPRAPARPLSAALAAALLGVAQLAVAPGAARAEPAPRTSSLSWVRLPGAEACIGSRALAIAVERRLQHEVFVPPSRAAVAVEGRIERTPAPASMGESPKPPAGFRAVITVSNEAGVELGNREIRSAAPSCAAMNDDLALVIAVMIDPEAALAPPLPAAPAPRPSAPVAPVAPLPVHVEPPPVPAPPTWRVSLQAGGMAMLGLLPRTSGGVLIRSHVEPPHFWAFEVGGVLFPPVEAEAESGAKSASFRLTEAFLSVCPLTLRAFGAALSACAGVQVGSILPGSFSAGGGSAPEQGIFNAALEGRVHRRLVGPLVAGAGLGLVVPVLRSRFSYVENGTEQVLFTMAPVGGAVDLSVGVEFP